MTAAFACSVRADVPSSERSRAVVDRVEPELKTALEKIGAKPGAPVFLRILKDPGVLELWIRNKTAFELFRSYPICKFSGKLGPKLKEGDRQAPEGCYSVAPEQMNPNSNYHLSFNLGFPNEFDRQHRRTGSELMVHGACKSVGCYAMGDEAIEEIWTLCSLALQQGQKSFSVHAFPFALTETNLARQATNEWITFWRDLKPIYEQFEKTRIPPDVGVKEGKYQLLTTKAK